MLRKDSLGQISKLETWGMISQVSKMHLDASMWTQYCNPSICVLIDKFIKIFKQLLITYCKQNVVILLIMLLWFLSPVLSFMPLTNLKGLKNNIISSVFNRTGHCSFTAASF